MKRNNLQSLQPHLSIIVPTYNEKDNLKHLIKRISKSLIGVNYEIIIIDDNSPDGTGRLAKKLSESYPIKVIVREEKKGLASAIYDGFKHAKGNILAVMDADLQHPPELLPELLNKINNGAELVIGSRFISGGGIRKWSLSRKILSRGARYLAYIFLYSIRKIKDPLSGFFMLKRTVLDNVKLEPIGYKLLLDILTLGEYNEVVEVPYMFEDRYKGKSSLTIKELFVYIKHLYKLAKKRGEITRFFKFCMVGVSGVFINLSLLWFLTEIINFFYIISAVLSIQASISSNFILNEFWTFRDRRVMSASSILKRSTKFNLVSIGGITINIFILWISTEFFGIHYIISEIFGIFGATLWNFGINTMWTWK